MQPVIRRSARTAAALWFGGLLTAILIGCGDSSPATTAEDRITFSADSLVVTPGSARPLQPSIGGKPLTGNAVVWRTSNPSVAVVATGGILTALAPGKTLLTASSGSATGTLSVRVGDTLHLGTFTAPLATDVSEGNVFDHDLPFEFSDNDGFLLSFWGEKLPGIDGHNGFDWPVRAGTAVLSAAEGVVTFAGNETPFTCPLLNNTTVSGMWVVVAHGLSDGQAVTTEYGHLSRIDVAVGQAVRQGEQLGLSGNTGCSTGAHLHFSVFRGSPADSASPRVMDPYGWQGATPDPWASDPRGTVSTPIWSAAGPQVFRELDLVGVFNSDFPIVLTKVRYLGVDDEHHPNNEYVDVAANPKFGDADLTGVSIVNSAGVSYRFPAGFRIAAGDSVRLFSGAGTNTASVLFWGRTAPVWDNTADCAEIILSDGTIDFNAFWGGSHCPGLFDRASVTQDKHAPALGSDARPTDVSSPYSEELFRVRWPSGRSLPR